MLRRSFASSAAPPLSAATRRLLNDTGAKIPIVKGPMYPGSNPELVAAVSEAGGFGVVQPISLTHLYGHDFREGLRLIKSLTSKPFGVNFTILDNAKVQRKKSLPPNPPSLSLLRLTTAFAFAVAPRARSTRNRWTSGWTSRWMRESNFSSRALASQGAS